MGVDPVAGGLPERRTVEDLADRGRRHGRAGLFVRRAGRRRAAHRHGDVGRSRPARGPGVAGADLHDQSVHLRRGARDRCTLQPAHHHGHVRRQVELASAYGALHRAPVRGSRRGGVPGPRRARAGSQGPGGRSGLLHRLFDRAARGSLRVRERHVFRAAFPRLRTGSGSAQRDRLRPQPRTHLDRPVVRHLIVHVRVREGRISGHQHQPGQVFGSHGRWGEIHVPLGALVWSDRGELVQWLLVFPGAAL